MRKNTLLILATLVANLSFGQEELILPANPTREIGLFGENVFTSTQSDIYGRVGIQYKNEFRENKLYRLMAGYGNYEYTSRKSYTKMVGDTLFSTQLHADVPMFFIGGGFEMQRHFYKRLHLYAAVELNAGYGKGTYNDLLIKEKNENQVLEEHYLFVSSTASGPVSTFALNATPFIGAKFIWNRLILGSELSLVRSSWQSVTFANAITESNMTFDLGSSVRQRIYLNYRF